MRVAARAAAIVSARETGKVLWFIEAARWSQETPRGACQRKSSVG